MHKHHIFTEPYDHANYSEHHPHRGHHHHHSEHLSQHVTDMAHGHHLQSHSSSHEHMYAHHLHSSHLPELQIEHNHLHHSYHQRDTAATPSHNGFGHQLLHRLGLPETAKNLDFLDAWQRAEGGHSYNPFNTTQRSYGGRSINSVGVQRYSSMEEGLNATIKTLKNGYYGSILQALRHNDPQTAKRALEASVWGTHRGVYLDTSLV